jgi:hypothetical protein
MFFLYKLHRIQCFGHNFCKRRAPRLSDGSFERASAGSVHACTEGVIPGFLNEENEGNFWKCSKLAV